MKRLALISLMMAGMSVVALGVWDPGMPAKWVQLPDLSSTGLDVMASEPKVLADDFLCRQPMPITDIHIWGSWRQDLLPVGTAGLPGDPTAVDFTLSICADISATQNPSGYSVPDDVLWRGVFPAGSFHARDYGEAPEGWFNPNTGEYVRQDHFRVWQYNFYIDPALAFFQKGTEANPIVYWLVVQAVPHDTVAQFGWKTSIQHWNDDAVWNDVPTGAAWRELIDPVTGRSLDLAFVITPEPMTMVLLALGGVAALRRRRG
jgi:hypothetical protein